MLSRLYSKYKELVDYVFWGVVSMLANILAYYFCFNIIGISNTVSTIIAWFWAVIIAYYTNRVYVFKTGSNELKDASREFMAFLSSRLATGIVDVAIMYVAVDCMAYSPTIWKTISNIVIVILNYILSKFLVFKK